MLVKYVSNRNTNLIELRININSPSLVTLHLNIIKCLMTRWQCTSSFIVHRNLFFARTFCLKDLTVCWKTWETVWTTLHQAYNGQLFTKLSCFDDCLLTQHQVELAAEMLLTCDGKCGDDTVIKNLHAWVDPIQTNT